MPRLSSDIMETGFKLEANKDTEQHDESTLRTTDMETMVNVSPPAGNSQVRLSQELVDFLESRRESPLDILSRPVVSPPPVDDSLPLSHYFISTSHNTYLLSYQLLGTADASAYTHVLSHACRCVEIDVWLSAHGFPIVTHGWTWSTHIPFRDVCVAIGNAVREDDWPVIISLECHIPVDKQETIVDIMKEVWGEKLVDKEVEGFEDRAHEVSPSLLRGKIILLVEYYPPKTAGEGDVSSSSGCDSPPPPEHNISPSLAALGIYGRSVKPHSGWLQRETTGPRHLLYNLSEDALAKLLPRSLQELVTNSLVRMRRVYPRGTRITSNNLVPLEHWRSGTNIAALNWQRYDWGLQLNEAMFVGSGGWITKPDRLRGNKPSDERRVRLSCEVIGACNMPKPSRDIKAYVYAELFVPSGEMTWKSQSRHSSSPPESKHADITWNDKFHWEYLEEDLTFLRLSVYREEWGHPDCMGTFCARIDYLQPGWRFMRLFGKFGCHNGGLLLVKFVYV